MCVLSRVRYWYQRRYDERLSKQHDNLPERSCELETYVVSALIIYLSKIAQQLSAAKLVVYIIWMTTVNHFRNRCIMHLSLRYDFSFHRRRLTQHNISTDLEGTPKRLYWSRPTWHDSLFDHNYRPLKRVMHGLTILRAKAIELTRRLRYACLVKR